MKNDYQPISCSLYDILEVAALKRKRLTLTVAGAIQEIVVQNVYARGREEFLGGFDPICNEPLHIRLDYIESFIDQTDGKIYNAQVC